MEQAKIGGRGGAIRTTGRVVDARQRSSGDRGWQRGAESTGGRRRRSEADDGQESWSPGGWPQGRPHVGKVVESRGGPRGSMAELRGRRPRTEPGYQERSARTAVQIKGLDTAAGIRRRSSGVPKTVGFRGSRAAVGLQEEHSSPSV